MVPRARPLGFEHLLSAVAVVHPRPPDDVLLRVPLREVGQRFPVSVPEFFTGQRPAERPDDHLTHHLPAGKIEADDDVGSPPHDVLRRAVVAVADPGVALEGGGEVVEEGRVGFPVGEVVHGIDLSATTGGISLAGIGIRPVIYGVITPRGVSQLDITGIALTLSKLEKDVAQLPLKNEIPQAKAEPEPAEEEANASGILSW